MQPAHNAVRRPAQDAVRRKRWFDGALLRSAVTVLMLVPVCVLFAQLWRGTAADIAFAEREREGVAYLDALNELTVALVDAQSAAVAERPVNGEALVRALDAVTEVDQRIGASLRAQQRWATLHSTVEALPDRQFSGPAEAFDVYRQATDLLLAQYDRVRESSNLVRDPEGDAYHLQDGAAEELPEAIVATGRFADLAVLLPSRPAQDRPLALVELMSSIGDVLSPADDLADNVQAAVESTDSRTMSSNLLTQVDRFRRSMDSLAAAAAAVNTADVVSSGGQTGSPPDDEDGSGSAQPSGGTALPDLGPLIQLRGDAQLAAAELAGTMLTELDGLVADRISALQRGQWASVGALVVAFALAAAPMVIAYLGQPSTTGNDPTASAGRAGTGHPPGPAEPGPGTTDQPARWPELDPTAHDGGSAGTAAADTGRRGPTVAAR